MDPVRRQDRRRRRAPPQPVREGRRALRGQKSQVQALNRSQPAFPLAARTEGVKLFETGRVIWSV